MTMIKKYSIEEIIQNGRLLGEGSSRQVYELDGYAYKIPKDDDYSYYDAHTIYDNYLHGGNEPLVQKIIKVMKKYKWDAKPEYYINFTNGINQTLTEYIFWKENKESELLLPILDFYFDNNGLPISVMPIVDTLEDLEYSDEDEALNCLELLTEDLHATGLGFLDGDIYSCNTGFYFGQVVLIDYGFPDQAGFNLL